MSREKAVKIRVTPPLAAVIAAVLACLVCLSLYQWDNKYTAPGGQPINGMLCLTEKDLADQPVRYLIREWEYYPGVLLTPEDLKANGRDYYRRYVSIGEYGGMELDREDAAPRGSGTYRLILSLPEEYLTYSLKMPVVYSAYRLYIGDGLLLEVGDPDPAHYQEALQEREVSFRGRGYVEILIAVTDQGGFYSGMVYPPSLGLPLTVSQTEAWRQLIFTIAELLALVMLALSVYLFLRSRQAVDIWVVPLCLCMMGYLAYPLIRLFFALPNYPWRLMESLCLYGFYAVLVQVYSVYYHWRGGWPLAMKVFSCALFLGAGAAACLTPFCRQPEELYLLSGITELMQWGMAANTACLAWRTAREREPFSGLLAAGAAVMCVTLMASHLLPLYEPVLSGWYPEVGMMAFLLILSLVEARDVSAAYRFRLLHDERLRQTERLLALEQAHYMSLQGKIEEARQARHDLRQHLNLAQSMLSRGETEELSQYLAQYAHAEQPLLNRPFQFCELHAADAVLSYYWDKAQGMGVDFDFSGQIPAIADSLSVDLCALLGNLLENALEALEKQTEGERFLRISARAVDGKLVFRVVNSCEGPARQEQKRFYSSKREELGVGTLSVQIIAEKHGGFASFTSEANRFTVQVFLPLPKEP